MLVLLKRYIGWILLLLLLLGGSGTSILWLWKENQRQKEEQKKLTRQLSQATEAQKEAIITRRISTQLEEIAYQQKEISDKQKQEAIHQTEIAELMRAHAELEREKALSAQQAALEAYDQMEKQKKLAETHREEAIAIQKDADTLAYRAVGRSLGSLASTQYTTGNKEKAAVLSYSAWRITSQYKGDVYQPVIFNALSQTCQLSKHLGNHKGAIRDMVPFPDKQGKYLLTASQYGELFLWEEDKNNKIQQKTIFSNPAFDFRKVVINNGNIYALSYTGTLLHIDKNKKQEEIPLDLTAPAGMLLNNNKLYIATKEGEIQVADSGKWNFQSFYIHPCPITFFDMTADGMILGDNNGGIYLLDNQGKTSLVWNKEKQAVTCVLSNLREGIQAIGYKSGLILYRKSPQETVFKELIGHISPVTRIKHLNNKLLSSSYDGSVRLWNNIYGENKIESAIVYQFSEWIHAFTIDRDGKHIFIGDERGNLSTVSISPKQMAKHIKETLISNLTQEELEYYLNEVSEYEMDK